MASPVSSCHARANASAASGSVFTPPTVRPRAASACARAAAAGAGTAVSATGNGGVCRNAALTSPSGPCHQPKSGAAAPKAAGPAARSVSMTPSRMVCSAGRRDSKPSTVAEYSGRLSLRDQGMRPSSPSSPLPCSPFSARPRACFHPAGLHGLQPRSGGPGAAFAGPGCGAALGARRDAAGGATRGCAGALRNPALTCSNRALRHFLYRFVAKPESPAIASSSAR